VGVEQLVHERDRDSAVGCVAESGREQRDRHVYRSRCPGVYGPMSEGAQGCRDRLNGAVTTVLVMVGFSPTAS
jgi:hypothetical protein